MTKEQAQAFAKELDGLSLDELNARGEELEAEKNAARERQRVLAAARARALRAERLREAEASIDRQGMRASAQYGKPGVAVAKGGRPVAG